LTEGSIIVQRGEGVSSARTPAELIELKRSEVRLISECGFSFDEPIDVLIAEGDGSVTQLAARASWVRPIDAERWLVRGRLKKELAADEQSRLAKVLKLERRKFPRYPSNLPANARWELADEQFAVRMLDVSVGGCRLQSPHAGEKGRRLVLEISGEERPILARVQWCKPSGNGFQLGCEILSFLE
jgi:hypothetical protein